MTTMFDSSRFIPTTEQNNALRIIERHIFEPTEPSPTPLRLLIYGEAGSGKRVLASMVAAMYSEHDREFELVCTSVLPNVAWLSGGFSMSALGIGTNGNSDAEIQEKWGEWTCLYLLNAEQASPELFDQLSTVMRRAKGSNDPFGGMNIIVSADFMQSFAGPSNTGSRLYYHPHLLTTVSALRGRAAFLLLNAVAILESRLKLEDPPWAALLRRLRKGSLSANDLDQLRTQIIKSPPVRYRGYMITNDIDLMKEWNQKSEIYEKERATQCYAVIAHDVPLMAGRQLPALQKSFLEVENAKILSPLVAGELLHPRLIIIENAPCESLPGFVIEPFGMPGNILAFYEAVKVYDDADAALLPDGVSAHAVELRIIIADRDLSPHRRHTATGDLLRSKREPSIFCRSSFQVFVGVQGKETTISRIQHAFQPAWSIFYDSIPGLKIGRPVFIDILGLRWFQESGLAALYTVMTRGPNQQSTSFWREVPDDIRELRPPQMVVEEENRIYSLAKK
ncbi:hypothetical protein GALMADRAFT_162445 [Galerina marginata CBS 339.88]|uniref:ATP-dependent DNA helicase n=1 Tax=Galerina marginata (strain CBS 339.88) TaxID=685588 RepID=A0A067SC50_GALM3|nr:hypothetical protein GALMADRAFT_162445 [Galerina marginata CBS 339.88]